MHGYDDNVDCVVCEESQDVYGHRMRCRNCGLDLQFTQRRAAFSPIL